MPAPILAEWPSLGLGVYLRRRKGPPPFPLGHPSCRIFLRARHGLWEGVKAHGVRPGDQVLTPAYHHGSEVEALLRAGLECVFYETGDLAPNPAELDALVGERVRALYLIHHLGFPQDVSFWRAWCDERGLILIEDAAQAWLSSWQSRPVGSFGDLAIFCMYKSFGVQYCSALFSKVPPPRWDSSQGLGLADVLRSHATRLSQSWPALSNHLPASVKALKRDPEDELALGDVTARPSFATVRLLMHVADPNAAVRRRANYRFLLQRLSDLVAAPFARPAEGFSPLVFPVETEGKEGLIRGLAAEGIAAGDLWPDPHPSLPVEKFPNARSLRARLVGLPVHQELRPRDLERIVGAVRRLRPRREGGE
jgi:hypothetical protein